MNILIAYDVETVTSEGQRRLRRVAKACLNYGQRVQNSVFECQLTEAQFINLKAELSNLINPDMDSIIFYNLGNNSRLHTIKIGKVTSYDVEAPLIL